MQKFVARQPILTAREKTFGYELLFRAGLEPFFRCDNPDYASSSVVDSFLLFGLQNLTAGTPAFINFTRELIVRNCATLLPHDQFVIELLEDIQPDGEVIRSCRSLKEKGYRIALDDFEYHDNLRALVDLADIVKVDFIKSPPETRRALAKSMKGRDVKLVAEKVETRDEFHEAVGLGYDYFQGYFFSKPEILQRKNIPGYKMHYLALLQAMNRPAPSIAEIEDVIKQEPSLCYRLLRYLNCPIFAFRGEIRSIRHALSLLGLEEIQKWTSLIAMAEIGRDKPAELVVTSMVRAKMCEILAPCLGFGGKSMELFLIGLLSAIDALLERPMPDILQQLAISSDVSSALLLGNTRQSDVLRLVFACEKADWPGSAELSSSLHIDDSTVCDAYLKAIEWGQRVFGLSKTTS